MAMYPKATIEARGTSNAKRLYKSIHFHGAENGCLSIAGAKQSVFLTVELSAEQDHFDEYGVFYCKEPCAGRKNMYNAFAVNRFSGQITVIGRELEKKTAIALAFGRKIPRRR